MLDYAKEIVYGEGHYAYKQLLTPIDNPYQGFSLFERIWIDAWWDAFYEDL